MIPDIFRLFLRITAAISALKEIVSSRPEGHDEPTESAESPAEKTEDEIVQDYLAEIGTSIATQEMKEKAAELKAEVKDSVFIASTRILLSK